MSGGWRVNYPQIHKKPQKYKTNNIDKINHFMTKTKKIKAEKREELRMKLKQRQTCLADQVRKMKMNKNYKGDAKKFV